MRGNYNNRGYNGNQEEYMRKIMEGADMYSYGRERYEGGDSEERMLEGLDKLMYALCGFVQSTMEFAKTNEEREIIRKHLNKMNNL